MQTLYVRLALAGTALLMLAMGVEGGEVGMGRGQQHPNLRLPDLEGRMQSLQELRGDKKLILFHFASW